MSGWSKEEWNEFLERDTMQKNTFKTCPECHSHTNVIHMSCGEWADICNCHETVKDEIFCCQMCDLAFDLDSDWKMEGVTSEAAAKSKEDDYDDYDYGYDWGDFRKQAADQHKAN